MGVSVVQSFMTTFWTLSFLTLTVCFPDQGRWTFSVKQQRCHYFEVHKALYKDSVVSINVLCDPSERSQKDTRIKIGYTIRESPCFEEYSGPQISRADLLGYYYSCPLSLPQDYAYNQIRYLKTKEIEISCNHVVDQFLGSLNASFVVGNIANNFSLNCDAKVDCGTSPPSLFPLNTFISSMPSDQVRTKRSYRTSRDTSTNSSQSQTKYIVGSGGIRTPDHLVNIPLDGVYLLVLFISGNNKFDATVNIEMKSQWGYLSAAEWPLLPFYGIMCIIYVLYAIAWLTVSAMQWRDLLRIQFWIGAVIFLGMIEKAVFYAEYQSVNSTGQSVKGAVLFAELLSCLKRTLARMLVIIVSLGFGIVKPRLGPMLHRVVCVGGLYFILSSIEAVLRVYKAKHDPTNQLIMAGIPLAVLDSVICWWIFSSLVQTTRTLRLRRNLVKLNLYRQFTNTLIFAVLASIVFMVWAIHRKFAPCLTDWRELWCDDAYWHSLFSAVVLVIMVLWRPTNNNQRYAFTPLLDASDDEGDLSDHVPISEAFDGMKMRQQRNSGSSLQNNTLSQSKEALLSKETEEDLKWIEENIPTSFVDSALPALVDSDEEIMTTKLERNKME